MRAGPEPPTRSSQAEVKSGRVAPTIPRSGPPCRHSVEGIARASSLLENQGCGRLLISAGSLLDTWKPRLREPIGPVRPSPAAEAQLEGTGAGGREGVRSHPEPASGHPSVRRHHDEDTHWSLVLDAVP